MLLSPLLLIYFSPYYDLVFNLQQTERLDSSIIQRCLLLTNNPHTQRKNVAYLAELDQHAKLMMPVYNELLLSKDSSRLQKSNILTEVIRQVACDRTIFIPTCMELLMSKNVCGALELLADIGTESDTAPIMILLLDESDAVRFEAINAIKKIGGKKDVIALDLWLRSGHWHDDKHHKERVQKMRDELVVRLKKEDDYRYSKPDPSDLKAKPFK